ncbi:Glutamyl-tRNA(Gln) amidotransferase subunit [Hyphodiscus hymeniophilus]|uniref:Glutamyl-tRNA(Gln) amidotransferase subunit A, mitochondrial n=1 Tax=Hyphodiscus hymeniophilus TaxID=353542 RepID=A0A9P6VML3_9HELO|nr:Glutamyl-tRNA(Gln) amidotransferase subunit [Hyphodiscus hymeniophilus]
MRVTDLSRLAAAELDRLVKGGKPRKKPFAVKDNIATKNHFTTSGSKILQKYQSPFEATVVDQLRNPKSNPKNGKVVLGKTNLDEFGMGSHSTNSFFGPVLGMSPLRRHSVGGSSGGSAMAVVTGECGFALGTDTGGSVRLPAAYTGIFGFKPSYGRISRWGVIPYANSLDTVGVLGTSAQSILETLTPEVMYSESRDPTSLGAKSLYRMRNERKVLAISSGRVHRNEGVGQYLQTNFRRLKIGIPMEYNIAELDPAVREEWRHALNLFQERGCTLVPVSLPNTKHALSAYYIIAAAEAASNLAKYDGVRYGTRADSSDGAGNVLYSRTRGEGLGDEVKRRILLGSYTLSSKAIDNYFIKAQKVRRLVQRDFDRVFALPNLLRYQEQFNLSDMAETVPMEDKKGPPQVDFIVCPTSPTLPPTRNVVQKQSSVETYMNDVFTVPSSLAGLPAISIPFKLPGKQPGFAGIQIIGQFSDDYRLLLTASALAKLQARKASLVKKHTAALIRRVTSSKGFQKGSEETVRIRTHLSTESFEVKTYLSSGKSFDLRKHPTVGGENRMREPRTAKEIDRFVEDAFGDWDSMTSGDNQK